MIFFWGAVIGILRTNFWISSHRSGELDQFLNKKISIEGRVIEEPERTESSTKIIVETLAHTKVLITADRYTNFAYGDELKIFGKVQKPRPIQTEEGDFAYDVYLARQGIYYNMIFPVINIISHHQAGLIRDDLIKIKNIILVKINQLFTVPENGLLAGLLVSGRSSLSKTEQNIFTRAGLIHIVALSGFNVTIIAQGIMAALIFLPKRLRLFIGALGIICFAIMTGLGATVVRASLMALLVIFSSFLYRTYEVGRALFLAVLVMALWNPMIIYDVSFQLSCVATFAVIFAVPPVLKKYASHLKFLPEKFEIRSTVIGTLIIEIFLLPILLYTSGQISLVTVISNLLVLPILPLVMAIGFFTTLLSFIHYYVALPFLVISNFLLKYILTVSHFLAAVPFGVFEYKINSGLVAASYFLILVWLWSLQKSGQEKNEKNLQLPELTIGTPLTTANLERLDNFFRSRSNSDFQKKP